MSPAAPARPIALALAVLTALALGGCGAHARFAPQNHTPHSAPEQQLPATDRTAFYQLASVIGLIRARGPADRDARHRLQALAPSNPTLRKIRHDLQAALAAHRPNLPQATTHAYTGLLHYQRTHPQVATLIPD